ncbi:hypothetical protein OEM_23930 [Mycobacterium intracellulare subsp. yongonense 05-1390]|nr:hypothetical protein OEM_23930 [Mycobacterium intracellulare subsp. yongonense 05-1390]
MSAVYARVRLEAGSFPANPDEVFVQPLRCQRVHRWRASGFDVLWLCGCVSRFVDASIMPRIARAGAIAPCVSAPV